MVKRQPLFKLSANQRCGACGETQKVDLFVASKRGKAGLPFPCSACGANLFEVGEPTGKRGRTDNQKRSQAQEKRAAKRMGGRVQPASGALSGAKGDVRKDGVTRMECKFTRAASFSLKLAELKKIEREAATAGENPAFEIEFQGVHPHERYVVVPGWLYDQLTEHE